MDRGRDVGSAGSRIPTPTKLDFVGRTQWISMVPTVAMIAASSGTRTTWRAAIGLMGTVRVWQRKIVMVMTSQKAGMFNSFLVVGEELEGYVLPPQIEC